MEVTLIPPPKSAIKAAIQGLRALQDTVNNNPSDKNEFVDLRGKLQMACQHPIYYLGRRSISEGRSIVSGEFAGWRFMIISNENVIADVEVVPSLTQVRPSKKFREPSPGIKTLAMSYIANDPTSESNYNFAKLGTGPTVASTVEAVAIMESNDVLSEGSLSLIKVPAIHLSLLWIQGAKNRFVPINSIYDDIEKYRFYKRKEIDILIRYHIDQTFEEDSEVFANE
jgi:hypothetical protein